MSTSEYDGPRPPDGSPGAAFSSYYGRPVVKPAPWSHEIAAYLFLGGVAGGSGVLAAGGQLTGRATLRRNARLSALAAVGLGGAALVLDLGRPERFLAMMRTVKPTSPMSLGTWILSGFGAATGIAAATEIDRMLGGPSPLRPLRAVEAPAGLAAAALGPPLAAYTAVLLGDTATPTWNAAHSGLPFVFVSSASLASAGLAMVTTPVAETGPARRLALLGVVADLVATTLMKRRMDPVAAEPLDRGKAGRMLRWSRALTVAGGVGTLLGGRRRGVATMSGLALLTASALTRYGVFDAGLESARDPRYTVEPQRRRLAARRQAGITHDAITTAD